MANTNMFGSMFNAIIHVLHLGRKEVECSLHVVPNTVNLVLAILLLLRNRFLKLTKRGSHSSHVLLGIDLVVKNRLHLSSKETTQLSHLSIRESRHPNEREKRKS